MNILFSCELFALILVKRHEHKNVSFNESMQPMRFKNTVEAWENIENWFYLAFTTQVVGRIADTMELK